MYYCIRLDFIRIVQDLKVGFCDIGSIFLFFMRKKKFGNEGGFFYFD